MSRVSCFSQSAGRKPQSPKAHRHMEKGSFSCQESILTGPASSGCKPFPRCPPSTPMALQYLLISQDPREAELPGMAWASPRPQGLEWGHFPRKAAAWVPMPDWVGAPLPCSSLCLCICKIALWCSPTVHKAEFCIPGLTVSFVLISGHAWSRLPERRLRDPWSAASPGDHRGTPKMHEKELFSHADEFLR